jgi:hypothetical protein
MENHLNNLLLAAQALRRPEEMLAIRREMEDHAAGDPRAATIDARLAAVRGGASPRDAEEAVAVALRAARLGHNAMAVRLMTEAFAAKPELARNPETMPRYNAACSAVVAGVGWSRDAPPAEGPDRAALRERGRAWLAEEVADWRAAIAGSRRTDPPSGSIGPTAAVAAIRNVLNDPDFAGVREPIGLPSLPAAEGAAWREIWAELKALLARAEGRETDEGDRTADQELPADPFAP